jgi:GNAT superfamily N-acetyltransferase
VTPTLIDLAEAPARYFLPVPGVDVLDRGDLALVAGSTGRGEVLLSRLDDVAEAVAWVRRESGLRALDNVRWWVGWRAEPADLVDQLLANGLVWNETPSLVGMTSQAAPPSNPEFEVRELRSVDEALEGFTVDWTVWNVPEDDREKRRVRLREHFDPDTPTTQFAVYLDGRAVGFGRTVDMYGAVALMGGTVLPEARGRGIYRALVRARWDYAVERGTPLLVVQAGPMSAPILARLGFESHGELHLLDDPGVAS